MASATDWRLGSADNGGQNASAAQHLAGGENGLPSDLGAEGDAEDEQLRLPERHGGLAQAGREGGCARGEIGDLGDVEVAVGLLRWPQDSAPVKSGEAAGKG